MVERVSLVHVIGNCQCITVIDLLKIHLPSVTGILKGYDQLLNLVLDEVQEEIQGILKPLSQDCI